MILVSGCQHLMRDLQVKDGQRSGCSLFRLPYLHPDTNPEEEAP